MDKLGEAGTDLCCAWGDADVRLGTAEALTWSGTQPSGVAGMVGRLGSIDDEPEPEPDRSLSSLLCDEPFLSTADWAEKDVLRGAFAGGGPGGGGGSGIPGSHLLTLEEEWPSTCVLALFDLLFWGMSPVDTALLDAGGTDCKPV